MSYSASDCAFLREYGMVNESVADALCRRRVNIIPEGEGGRCRVADDDTGETLFCAESIDEAGRIANGRGYLVIGDGRVDEGGADRFLSAADRKAAALALKKEVLNKGANNLLRRVGGTVEKGARGAVEKGARGAVAKGARGTVKKGAGNAVAKGAAGATKRVAKDAAGTAAKKTLMGSAKRAVSFILKSGWKTLKLAWMFVAVPVWNTAKKIAEQAAKVLRIGEDIATGFGTKRMNNFLGEAEGGGDDAELKRFTDYAANSLGQSEKNTILSVYSTMAQQSGYEAPNIEEMGEDEKNAIVGAFLMKATEGISSGDDQKMVEAKIAMNLEGGDPSEVKAGKKDGNGATGQNGDGTQAGGAETQSVQGGQPQDGQGAAVENPQTDGPSTAVSDTAVSGDGSAGVAGGADGEVDDTAVQSGELSAQDLKDLRTMFKMSGL